MGFTGLDMRELQKVLRADPFGMNIFLTKTANWLLFYGFIAFAVFGRDALRPYPIIAKRVNYCFYLLI
jgi:hypothetical protein